MLHALRASDGSQRWQSDVPSRVGAVAVAGDVVWLTSSDIFSQGRDSDLIALDRQTGAELRHLSWDDNSYGHENVSFADGKVVINQGGSAGSSPSRLRVFGLAGPRPTVTTPVLPLGRTGQSYSATLEASGVAPITWAVDSGSLPAGLSLSAGGAITGTPTSAGTSRFVVRATAANGRSITRSLPLSVVTSGTPSWTTSARDATRNAFEPGTGQLDLSAAPSIAFRWKTAPPGTTQFGNDQDVALSGTTLYTVGWDGVLKAFDTTGSQANRTPLWTALPSAGTGQGYTGAPTVSGSRIFVLDTDGRLHGVDASTGADLWHTDQVSGGWTAPLVVGSDVFIRDNTTSFRGYAVSDGTPLWGGNPATTTGVISSLSSDGSRIYALTGGCEVVAVDVGTGALVWHVPIRDAPPDQCVAGFAGSPPTPMVVGGKVYATEPAGRAVLDAATGAVDLRFGVYGSGESSGVLVGGLWCFESDSHILAVDTTTGELAWRSAGLGRGLRPALVDRGPAAGGVAVPGDRRQPPDRRGRRRCRLTAGCRRRPGHRDEPVLPRGPGRHPGLRPALLTTYCLASSAWSGAVGVVRRQHPPLGRLDARRRCWRPRADRAVSLVVPARNEAATVGDVVTRVREALVDTVALLDEIVVIDSDSTDDDVRRRHRRRRGRAPVGGDPARPRHACPARARRCGSRCSSPAARCSSSWTPTCSTGTPTSCPGCSGRCSPGPRCELVKGFYERPMVRGRRRRCRSRAAGSPSWWPDR